jgi:hypothetical protein
LTLTDGGRRARWLLVRGEALMGDAAKGEDARASLEAAAALFKTAAPRDPRYPDALTDRGAFNDIANGVSSPRPSAHGRRAKLE